MAMRLEWSRFAQADRDAIFDYIEADSPLARWRFLKSKSLPGEVSLESA